MVLFIDIVFGLGQKIIADNTAKDVAKQENQAAQIVAAAEQIDREQKKQYYINAALYIAAALGFLVAVVLLFRWVNK